MSLVSVMICGRMMIEFKTGEINNAVEYLFILAILSLAATAAAPEAGIPNHSYSQCQIKSFVNAKISNVYT